MAANNSFFDWSASLTRFVKRDTARAEEINDALDSISNGFTATEALTNAAIKLPAGETSTALGNAAARKGRVLTFNAVTGAAEAAISAVDVATVAGVSTAVTTVSASIASVNTVAANIADVNVAASNIVAIAAATPSAASALNSKNAAAGSAAEALASANAAAAVTGIPLVAGNALKVLRVNAAADGMEWGIGTSVQPLPALTTPAQFVTGIMLDISFSGTSALAAQSIASFILTWWDGSTQTIAASGNAGTASKLMTGSVGDVKTVSVVSVDTLGNQSAVRTNSITLVVNNPPTGTLTVSAPTTVKRLSTGNQISFSGVTDADAGDSVTYTITSSGLFTLSKTNGIVGGEIVTFTAPEAAVDTATSITVKAVDTRGGETATVTTNITIKAVGIVGVVLKTTGGGGGIWSHIDKDGADIADPGTSWFNAVAPWSGIVDQTVDAQAMVKIPKFYYKVGTIASGANAGKTAWWIADDVATGFTLHPAFMNAGAEIAQFWYGKYQASMTGAKLDSKAGVLPTVSRSLTQFIADAAARNVSGVTGFMLHSFWQWSAVQFLYLVENKTMDSQTKTGQGLVSASAAENVDSATVAQATYRGMVGLWGNVRQWMDGLRTTSGAIYVWDANGNKTFTNTGKVTGAAASKYPLTFVSDGTPSLAAGFLPATFAASGAAATTPDQQYFSDASEYFPIVGGDWINAADAGLWCVICYSAASYVSTNFGARLAKV